LVDALIDQSTGYQKGGLVSTK